MQHDRMCRLAFRCPCHDEGEHAWHVTQRACFRCLGECQCELIAAVRKDERRQDAEVTT